MLLLSIRHFRCTMTSTSLLRWTTSAASRSRKEPEGPSCVIETVRGSSPLSGASRTGSLSAPHQVHVVAYWPLAAQCHHYTASVINEQITHAFLWISPMQDTRVQTLTGPITSNSARPKQLHSSVFRQSVFHLFLLRVQLAYVFVSQWVTRVRCTVTELDINVSMKPRASPAVFRHKWIPNGNFCVHAGWQACCLVIEDVSSKDID